MSVLVGSAADIAGVKVDGSQEAAYVAKVLALSPIAYWILGEHTPSTTAICQVNRNQNGTHTNVTLGNAGIGDGQVCPLYNGTTSETNIYSATFAASFNGSEGTLVAWGKVSGVGVWTDGAFRYVFRIRADASNYIRFLRTNVNGTVQWDYVAGGTTETVSLGGLSTTAWIPVAITWNKAIDEVKAYWNGAQTGLTQSGLGVWVGSPVNGATAIGSGGSLVLPWDGYISHVALWNSALTPAQIATLASV